MSKKNKKITVFDNIITITPDFNYGEFAAIKSQAGLNSYKISVKEWVSNFLHEELPQKERPAKLTQIAINQMQFLLQQDTPKLLVNKNGDSHG